MTNYKYKNLIFILPILFIVFGAVFIYLKEATKVSYGQMENYVLINEKPISVMVADEIEEQWQGLSDRGFLGADNGMLFDFSYRQERTFVMRRMNFPLDIIWIDGNKIIKIDKRLDPEGANPINKYSSGLPVTDVLEVNGGYADAHGMKVGDEVEIFLDTDNE